MPFSYLVIISISTYVQIPQEIGKALHFLCPSRPVSLLTISPHVPFIPVIETSLSSLNWRSLFTSLYKSFPLPQCHFPLIYMMDVYSSFQRCLLITSHLYLHPYELTAAILYPLNINGITPLEYSARSKSIRTRYFLLAIWLAPERHFSHRLMTLCGQTTLPAGVHKVSENNRGSCSPRA